MKQSINPALVRPPFGKYSHGIVVEGITRTLFTSGQLGISLDDHVPENVGEQSELCFEAIGAILSDAGMEFSDVVRIAGFVTRREDFPIYMAVRDRYVAAPLPVSTLVIVSGFTRPEFLVEVEITAVQTT